MLKNQALPFVEIKTVTWMKDSHGLFDYESKSVNFAKNRVETSSHVYKNGNDISVKSQNELQEEQDGSLVNGSMDYLFSIEKEEAKKDDFYLKATRSAEEIKNRDLFLIVRSLKTDDGTQKGYTLELGDIVRLGRIEYRVIEYQTQDLEVFSLLNSFEETEKCPFDLAVKDCNSHDEAKRQCKICLLEEGDSSEVLIDPCNCKGTSKYVHIKCLQDWINSKVKKKVNAETTCIYWKKLNCEICKVTLPDLVDVSGEKLELVPIYRPEGAYILLERVFYDLSKSSSDNSKTMVLLSLSGMENMIKIGRGHECDLRENDISVSRFHSYIKYQDGKFVIFDNNSKFGTLIVLRKDYKIEKRKIALQMGRTVLTFSLKYSSVNEIPLPKLAMVTEKPICNNSPTEEHLTPEQNASSVFFGLGQQAKKLNGSFSD